MRKAHRIILILLVGAMVGSLTIAVTSPGAEPESSEVSTWSRLTWAWDDAMEGLGLLRLCSERHLAWRRQVNMNKCIPNLTQIDGARATWALETKHSMTNAPAAMHLRGDTNLPWDTTCHKP